MRSTTGLPYVWMLLGSFSFAWMGSFAHSVGRMCEWQVVALARSSLVFLFVGILAWFCGTKFVFWKPSILWLRSISGSMSMVCTFYALTHLPVSTVLTVTNIFPIWVALLSWPMLGKLPSIRVWMAVFGSVIGVSLIYQPELTGNELAFWSAFGASIFTAIAMLGLNKLKGVDSRAVVVHFSGVAMVFCLSTFWFFPQEGLAEPYQNVPAILLLIGVGITASIGQLFLTKAFTTGEPAKVSVVGLTQVLFGLLLDLIWAGYSVNWQMLLGMILILLPTGWVMLEKKSEQHLEE